VSGELSVATDKARSGESDDADAAGAAAAVLAGEALGEPKTADGAAGMVRALRVAGRSAVRARAKAYAALQDLVVTAPAALREQLTGLYKDHPLHACQQLAEPENPTTPIDAVTVVLRSLAASSSTPKPPGWNATSTPSPPPQHHGCALSTESARTPPPP
jgi:hypothetical protein